MSPRRRTPALLFLLPVVVSVVLLWHLRHREPPSAPIAPETGPAALATNHAPERPEALQIDPYASGNGARVERFRDFL